MQRALSFQSRVDEPLGELKDVSYPVHVLSYAGVAVPSSIGAAFSELVRRIGEDISVCPVLAATKGSGAAAVGQPRDNGKKDATFRLESSSNLHHFMALLRLDVCSADHAADALGHRAHICGEFLR